MKPFSQCRNLFHKYANSNNGDLWKNTIVLTAKLETITEAISKSDHGLQYNPPPP